MFSIFYQNAVSYANALKAQLHNLENQIKETDFPPGKLTVHQNGSHQKWFVNENGHLTYLPKAQRKIAESLAHKLKLTSTYEDYQKELKAVSSYLKKHDFSPSSMVFQLPGNRYQELLGNIQTTHYPNSIMQWWKSPYQKDTFHEENKIFKSKSGSLLRSKSEVCIDELLFHYQIPYHYEQTLILPNGHHYSPDFTIYSLKFQRFLYWEHLGQIDKLDYLHKNEHKLEDYIQNNILPQRDLIITVETKDFPLSSETVEAIIHQYLIW